MPERIPTREGLVVTRQPKLLEAGRSVREARRPHAGVSRKLLVADFVALAAYISWWVIPGHVGTPPLFVALAIAETFFVFHGAGLWWTLWTERGDTPAPRLIDRTVDILITTCGEPLEMLERTFSAVAAVEGEHSTFVLDDAGRPEVAELAHRFGATYLARGTRRGAKAGNLNDALAVTEGELVAIFDADQAPHPDFLSRLAGHFDDPKIAFAQAPQFYSNALYDKFARGAYQQQALFYGPILRGKYARESVFCCGTNFVIRRAALEDVGGFDETSVVEDLVTSMRLHRSGWRSAYHPYILVSGLSPPTVGAYLRQQFRWARGTVGALVAREPLKRGYRRGQRFQYLLATSFFLVGLVHTVYILVPLLYVAGGWSAFAPGSASFLYVFVPYLALSMLTMRAAMGGELRLEHLRHTYGSFPVYAAGAIAAILRLPTRFRVTGARDSRLSGAGVLGWLTVAAFAASGAAVVLAPILRPTDSRTFSTASWALVNMAMLSTVTFAVVRQGLPRLFARRAPGAAPSVIPPATALNGTANGNGNGTAVAPLPEHILPSLQRAPARPPIRRPGAILAAITLAALGLRLGLSNTESVRLDEATSWGQSQLSLPKLWHLLATQDTNPPLFSVLQHFMVKTAGDSPLALRGISIVVGTAAIPLIFLVARRVAGTRAALWSAAIGAVAPFWVWYSDEGRAYMLLATLALAATYALMMALDRGRLWRWALYAVLVAACFYTHFFAILLLPAHLLYVALSRCGARRMFAWAASLAAATVLFMPFVIAWLGRSKGKGDITSVTNTAHIQPEHLSGPIGVLSSLTVFGGVLLAGYVRWALLAGAAAVIVGAWPVATLAVGLRARRPRSSTRWRGITFLLGWFLLPLLALFLLREWKPEVWIHRYAMVATPALFILIGALLGKVPRKVRFLAPAAVAAVLGITVFNVLSPGNTAREDFRGAASVLRSHMQPRDLLFAGPSAANGVRYYVRDRPIVVVSGPARDLSVAHRGASLYVVTLYNDTGTQTADSWLDSTFPRTAIWRIGTKLQVARYGVPAGYGVSDAAQPTVRSAAGHAR